MKNEDDNQTKNIPKGAIVRVSLAKTSWQDRLQLQFPVLQVTKKASNMSKKQQAIRGGVKIENRENLGQCPN